MSEQSLRMSKEEREAAYHKALAAALEEMEGLLREQGRLQGEINALNVRKAHLETVMKRLEKLAAEGSGE